MNAIFSIAKGALFAGLLVATVAIAPAVYAGPAKDKAAEKVDPEQKENVEQLKTDVEGMKAKSDVTEQQVQQLKTNLKTTLQGAQKPSQESVDKLIEDLTEFYEDGELTYREIMAIQEDVKAVLNSANISDEQIAALKADVQAIAEASNLTEEDIQTLVNDVMAIVNTAKANAEAAKANAAQ